MSGYFTKQTLLLIYCAFVGLNNKAVSGFNQTKQYILFYFIFILATCFGQLTIISLSLLQTTKSFNLHYF
jgi:hypothetical protein